MISPRKLLVATILCFLGLVTLAGAYVQPIIVQYRNAVPCGKLTGFPRLLRAVGIISGNQGDCQLNVMRTCKSPGAACTFVDPGTGQIMRGSCTNVLFSGCVCTVPPEPDLSISKTHSGNFYQGQTGANYTITVTNSGTGQTSGTISMTDTLPEGLTATSIAGTNWTCTQPGGPCSRTDALASGASYDAITLTVDVTSTATISTVTNTASVSGGGESNLANDTANDATSIAPFQITSVTSVDPGHIMLTGSAVPNDSNAIEAVSDLTQQFQFLSSVVPDGSGAFQFQDGDPGTHRFYRLTHP